ncbi:hypothetical protein AT251_05610 [Enterovibrio nigricans]|nr:Ig-like domain-containing protein [Enterovibrio nigricans]PKF51260.1 hypothetical protein AT251_05610 [Enterovibrio nigricans]
MKKFEAVDIKDIVVSGLDIKIKQPDGMFVTIENGISDLLKNNIEIVGSDGVSFTKNQIISKVNLEGSSAVLVPDLLASSETGLSGKVEKVNTAPEPTTENELKKLESQLAELKKLREEIERLKKEQEQEQEQEQENTSSYEAVVNEDVSLINELVNQLSETIAAALSGTGEGNAQEQLIAENNANTSKNKTNNVATSTDSGSGSSNQTPQEQNTNNERNNDLFLKVDLATSSDSGKKNDFITNVNTPTFIGSSITGATITATIAGVTNSVVVDAQGSFTLTLPYSLADGNYNVSFVATDILGAKETINKLLVIDTVAPSVEFSLKTDSGLSENDNITNIKTPTIIGKVSGDPVSITLTINSVDYAIPAENGNFSFTVPEELSDGVYDVKVIAEDEAGNKTEIIKPITIDTINNFSVDLSQSSDTGITGDWVTNNTKPILRIEHEKDSSLRFFINGVQLDIQLGSESPSYYELPNVLTDGTYNLEFISTDLAGNKVTINETLIIDTVPPNFSLDGISDKSNSGDKSDYITSDGKPTFIGVAEAGSKVFLTINGNVYSSTVGENGKWSITPSIVLLDNNYNVTAYAVDIAGNKSETKNLTITIDTIGPLLTGGFDSKTDTGSSNSDGITNSENLSFSGSTEIGAIVRLQIQGLSYDQKVVVGESGQFSFDLDNVAIGKFSYVISAVDVAGNESINNLTGTVIVDRSIDNFTATLSADSDSGESNSDQITNNHLPKFVGTGEVGASIYLGIYRDDLIAYPEFGPSIVNSNGNWEYLVPTEISDGSYVIQFRIVDLAGNSSSVKLPITIDSVVSNFTALFDSVSDSQAQDGITNIDRPSFSGSAESGSRIVLNLSHSSTGTNFSLQTVTNSDGSWAIQVPEQNALNEQGQWTWTAIATDIAGNSSVAIDGLFTFDNVAPQVTVTLESEVGFLADHTNDSTLNFRVATEANAKVVMTIYSVQNGVLNPENVTPTLVVGSDGVLGITIPTLSDGVYAYKVQVIDVAGNETVTEPSFVTIDTDQPELGTISLTDASDSGVIGDNITNNTELTLKGVGSEIGSLIHVSVRNSSTGEVIASTPSSFSVTSTNWIQPIIYEFPEGKYVISLYAEDAAGNISESKGLNVVVDTTPPPLSSILLSSDSDTGVSDTDFITKDTTPTFVGSSEKGATITLSIFKNGVLNKTAQTEVVNSDGTWNLTTPILTQGIYTWSITARDAAGNENTINNANQTLVIDTTYIGATVSLSNESNSGNVNDNITNIQNVTLTGKGEVGSSVRLTSLTSPQGDAISLGSTAAVVVDSMGNWHINLPLLSNGEGNYSWTVSFTDIAGNTINKDGIVVLDTSTTLTAELISDTGISNSDAITNDKTPTFVGSGEVGATVQIIISGPDGVISGGPAVVVSGDNSWSITIPELQIDGNYTWSAKTIDVAGNEHSTENKSFLLDTINPTIINANLDTKGGLRLILRRYQ